MSSHFHWFADATKCVRKRVGPSRSENNTEKKTIRIGAEVDANFRSLTVNYDRILEWAESCQLLSGRTL